MKVLHISASDRGGAGIAAVRLHEALLGAGIDSKLLTLAKHETEIDEHYIYNSMDVVRFPLLSRLGALINRVLKRIGLKSDYYRTFRNRQLAGRPAGYEVFSFSISEHNLERHPLIVEADVVHLHWVCDGFLDFGRFFSKVSKKVVWTLHDMNPFTGGCHHADECLGYLTDCRNCPQLEGTPDSSLAHKMLARKIDTLVNFRDALAIVSPSNWLMHCSEESILFRNYEHHQICNVVESKSYSMMDREICRQNTSLPKNKKIILCVAHDVDNPRKGYDILLAALAHMQTKDVLLCTIGNVAQNWIGNPSIVQLGYIMESSQLCEIYNAADVFVLTSAAENFPNTIVESLMCGTPVVSFGVGGIPEQINEDNGLLVSHRTAESLSKALDHFFGNLEAFDRKLISKLAKSKYDDERIVSQYEDIYQSMKRCS